MTHYLENRVVEQKRLQEIGCGEKKTPISLMILMIYLISRECKLVIKGGVEHPL
jgi:hypothetical protein